MSLCFRSLSGRLSSLVSSRKPLSKLDRHHVQKHVSSSTFLKQFLGTQRALSIRANTESKASLPFVEYTLHPNLSLGLLDTCSQWNGKLVKQYNGSKSMAMYWAQSPQKQHNRLQKVVLSKNKKHLAPTRIASENVTVFQMRNVEHNKNTLSLDNSRIISSRSLHSSKESNSDGIVFTFNDTSILKTDSQSSSPSQDEDKPSQEKLQYIVDCLSSDLPKLFVTSQNYTIYTQNIIFINNIRGVTTVGLGNYVKQILLLRMIGHIKFAHVKFHIIKITMHPEEATVKIRWRIQGVTGWKMIFSFWKYKVWKIQETIDESHDLWYDGFSTYYVNGEGKIYKHVADKVMPDQDMAKKEELRIAAKLALCTGLANNI